MRDWLTLKELDERMRRPKGSAFRAFKALARELDEGRDFRVLDPRQYSARIEALRSAGRIYRSSVNVVLLSPSLVDRLLELH